MNKPCKNSLLNCEQTREIEKCIKKIFKKIRFKTTNMYQVTASQTESNIRLIEIVKRYRQLYDSSDQNYKNSVFVENGKFEFSEISFLRLK